MDASEQRRKPLFSRVFGFSYIKSYEKALSLYEIKFTQNLILTTLQNRTVVIRQNRQLIFSRKWAVLANEMPFLLISPKIVPKIQLIKKGGCFEYHAVIKDKIEYRYIHRASICPHRGWIGALFMPKTMGKYKRLEVFYLSKPVYTADKPSDCHYCYFWTNGRKGCRLGRNNCYYLISLPPKPKSECDGCPYGRDHPCIGWCTKKVMREVGLR